MEHQSSSGTIYIPLQAVTQLINLSASSIRRLECAGDFPQKRKLSARRIGYVLAEIQAWAENRSKA
ncbi:AlpA family phage regulatory protein [Geobacter hydrogenophilus]|uniref:AlpA family phage regulatory protein n=1 Tax=Geobacter hydrogenophilus TaxID=40983 RepID=A0A9W6G329_9BACT|nr:AlpA family phage regulatory protein [Geobacter hydrogenophilus]GLI39474.1 hypothetical protein GHYDROH2_29750 [Geobacter hydrogenophilus]